MPTLQTYESNEMNCSIPTTDITLSCIAQEQRELVLNLRELLGVMDESIGFKRNIDANQEKREPCMLNYFKDTNMYLCECLQITENIKRNLGIN